MNGKEATAFMVCNWQGSRLEQNFHLSPTDWETSHPLCINVKATACSPDWPTVWSTSAIVQYCASYCGQSPASSKLQSSFRILNNSGGAGRAVDLRNETAPVWFQIGGVIAKLEYRIAMRGWIRVAFIRVFCWCWVACLDSFVFLFEITLDVCVQGMFPTLCFNVWHLLDRRW